MKKLLTLLIGLMLLMPMALAGAPTSEPFTVYIKFDGSSVSGLDVRFTCNGMTVTQVTNNLGGVLVNVGEYGHFKDVGGCTILEVDCGYESCRETFNVDNLDCPMECINTYELSEAPPEPEPECTVNSDCATGYECVSEECTEIYIPPIVEDKVSSNADNTIASVESNFGDCIDVVITDSKLSKLFDGIIDFNTEDYDTHEEILVKYCIETSLDDVDYGLVPYVLFEEGKIEYRYVFDDTLPCETCDEIARDEELEINFLGEDIEIIYLSSNKMIIRHGEMFLNIKEGEDVIYNGLPLTIGVINDNFVYVTYNGDSEKIYEDEIGEVGGIQVYVDEAVPNEDGDDLASLRISDDIEETIEDGDKYNENWDYIIGEGYIGIRNSKDYKYLDEETKPLALGDKIVFPNNFATIKFNEITDSETTEIRIKVRDNYFNVFGEREDGQDDSFIFNNKDYDELFISAEGILDEDKVLITTNSVRIGESDVYLEKGSIIIGDLVIDFDFLDILYKGISFALKDDNYLTYEGLIFKNPEKSVQDQSTFDIIVPDEIPEIVITIGAESETVGIEPEPIVCENRTTVTKEECEEVDACEEYIEIPCEVCDDCPIIPEGVTRGQIIVFITSLLGVGGIGLYAGKKLTSDRISKIKGVTYKVVVERDGDIREEHLHRGLRNYHSINTSHREVHERHPKGERYPLYEKDETGTYNYIGG